MPRTTALPRYVMLLKLAAYFVRKTNYAMEVIVANVYKNVMTQKGNTTLIAKAGRNLL